MSFKVLWQNKWRKITDGNQVNQVHMKIVNKSEQEKGPIITVNQSHSMNLKIDSDTTVSTWMHLPWPAVTLAFDRQNLIRSSVAASEYSTSVLSKLFTAFMRYRGNNI